MIPPVLMVRCPGPPKRPNGERGHYRQGPCAKGRVWLDTSRWDGGWPHGYVMPGGCWVECPTCRGETWIPAEQAA